MHVVQRAFLAVLACAASATVALAQKVPTETATFAGGCYWCTESDFDKVDGVISTTPGFMGGTTPNPTYKAVGAGKTGHAEVVKVEFDPARVTYAKLIEYFWRTVDPTDAGGQFCDRGDSYRTAVFTHSDSQRAIATASKQRLADSSKLKQPIVTEIAAATTFTPSDRADDHKFYQKHPGHYLSYRAGCGRDARLKALWGDEAGGKHVLH
jgi:peptide-methionine (S)-S-oxide reductase